MYNIIRVIYSYFNLIALNCNCYSTIYSLNIFKCIELTFNTIANMFILTSTIILNEFKKKKIDQDALSLIKKCLIYCCFTQIDAHVFIKP